MRLLGPLFGLSKSSYLSKLTRNHWRRWTHALVPFLAIYRGARKASDRTGKDMDYLRCLPEATFSTCGLILLSLWRWKSSSGEGHREASAEFLSCFLNLFFSSEDVEAKLCLSAEAKCRAGSVHSQADVVVPIDGGSVFVASFTEHSSFESRQVFEHLAALEAGDVEEVGVMPLHRFLFVVFCMGVAHITTQLVGQVASLMKSYQKSASRETP